ncbi:hypothetical protein BDQ17DRAFT_1335681 [Cyathus striatus]|nr:hypothetical protein BDQ17DRAFT_1335681 [Cyathus striatus]
MSFKHAHNFAIEQAQMIDTQNIYNQPNDEPLSPLRTSAPCTSQNFIGQEIYLMRLHEHFAQANTTERKMFLLYGMGGVGKTQICLKFNDEKTGQYTYTFWIDATSEDTIIQSLKEIYKKTSSPGTSSTSFSATAVLNWISNLEYEWPKILNHEKFKGVSGYNRTISKSIFERAAKYFPENKELYNYQDIPSYLPSIDVTILNINEFGEWNDWIFTESIELLIAIVKIDYQYMKSNYGFSLLDQF